MGSSASIQVVRRLIRAYIEERTGKPWNPEEDTEEAPKGRALRRSPRRG